MASESVALVTGSSRGIGRGIATALAARGWHLMINYTRDKTAAEAAQREVEEARADARRDLPTHGDPIYELPVLPWRG